MCVCVCGVCGVCNIINSVLLHLLYHELPKWCTVNVKSHMRTSDIEVVPFPIITCACKPVEAADLLMLTSTVYKHRILRWACWKQSKTAKWRELIKWVQMEDNSIPGFKFQVLVLVSDTKNSVQFLGENQLFRD